jgi:cytochrome c oxidase cbb3-type subunit 1
MTAPVSTAPQADAPAVSAGARGVPVAEIDQSCRLPVLLLLTAAACWLGLGVLLALLSDIKAHAPGFLADPAWLTYGRVRPASLNALAYGFALQAGLGLGLWMTCRLGRNLLPAGWVITLAGAFWNVGVCIGLGGILAGGSTSYEWLEMPRPATPILFWSYALVSVWGLIALHLRQERRMYVSQWFLLAALLWFPWIYSTAELLLLYLPVRGVMQAIVDGWYAHNLFSLCLGSLGLAAVFYFLPKLLKRPLYNEALALFGFWLLVLFDSWGGLQRGEPVPNWLSSVSVIARVLSLVPVIAIGLSWHETWMARAAGAPRHPLLRFFLVAGASYLVAAALAAAGSLPGISSFTVFTLYPHGLTQLRLHGFLAMALTGGIYYAAPYLTGHQWPSPRLIQTHFWCALVGMILSVIALLLGGIVQGVGLDHPQTPFLTVLQHTVPFLGTSSLGTMLLCIGYGAFVLHLGQLLTTRCPCAAVFDWFTSIRRDGARSPS